MKNIFHVLLLIVLGWVLSCGYSSYKGTVVKVDTKELTLYENKLALYNVGDTIVIEERIIFDGLNTSAHIKKEYYFKRKDNQIKANDTLVKIPDELGSSDRRGCIIKEKLGVIIKQGKKMITLY